MRTYNVNSVYVSKRRLKKKPESRIDITAGGGYGPCVLKPAQAIRLGKALIKMGTEALPKKA